MTTLLYISISSGLTKDEIIEIDKGVTKNREVFSLFVRRLPSNSKGKAKRLFVYGMFLFQLGQPLVPYAIAVVMSLPPVAIHRLLPIEQDRILSNKNSYPQIAHILEEKVDKIRLTNEQIKQFNNLAIELNSGSITMEEEVLQLRGVDGFTNVVAVITFVIFMNWYDSLVGVEAFQANSLPHQDPFGWLSGKYDSKNADNGQCLFHPPSRFERETLQTMKQICAASVDENGFVMTYDEAYNLIKETYVGSMQITEDCKITDWQGAKKAYHFQKGFGIDLGKYQNISKEDLVSLQNTDGGLIPYVQKGVKLPPIELIKDCQQKIYYFCHLENTEINRDATHYGLW